MNLWSSLNQNRHKWSKLHCFKPHKLKATLQHDQNFQVIRIRIIHVILSYAFLAENLVTGKPDLVYHRSICYVLHILSLCFFKILNILRLLLLIIIITRIRVRCTVPQHDMKHNFVFRGRPHPAYKLCQIVLLLVHQSFTPFLLVAGTFRIFSYMLLK